MPAPISLEKRKLAVDAYLEGGRSAADVAAEFGFSVPSLRRFVARARSGDGLASKKMGGARRERYFNADGEAVLRDLVSAAPDASLQELADAAAARLGGSVAPSTVWRALRRMGFEKVRPERVPTPPPVEDPHRYRDVHRRPPTATAYPTNVTDAEWGVLEPLFEGRFPSGRAPTYSDRFMLDAMLYVVRTGCAWRMLPKDFPPWRAVYGRFRRWADSGLLEEVHDALRRMWRVRAGRTPVPSAGIVDSQSVKTTEQGGLRGYDGGKKSEGA